MTQLMANKTLQKWVDILSLQDWFIKIEPDVSPDDMHIGDVDGETEWTESNKTALIRVLSPAYYGDRITPYNFERILVHELLHLKLSLLGQSGNDVQDRYVHQLIDDLAKAFIKCKEE